MKTNLLSMICITPTSVPATCNPNHTILLEYPSLWVSVCLHSMFVELSELLPDTLPAWSAVYTQKQNSIKDTKDINYPNIIKKWQILIRVSCMMVTTWICSKLVSAIYTTENFCNNIDLKLLMNINLQLWFSNIVYSMYFKWQSLSTTDFFGVNQCLSNIEVNTRFMATGLLEKMKVCTV